MKSNDVQIGDIGFAHTGDFIGKTIRFGEWLRFRKGSWCNHVFMIDRIENGIPYVIQADFHGVTNSKPLSDVGTHTLMRTSLFADVDKARYFYRKQLKDGYGFWSIFFLAVDILTPKWFPAFHPSSKGRPSWICSTLGAEALRFGGWYHEWPDPMLVTPAQLYDALKEEFDGSFVEVDAPSPYTD